MRMTRRSTLASGIVGSLGVGADEPPSSPSGSPAPDAHRVGDGVHRAAAEERDLRDGLWAGELGAYTSRKPVIVTWFVPSPPLMPSTSMSSAPEVLRGAVEARRSSDLAHDPVVPERAREAERGRRVAQVAPTPRVEDDADAGHLDSYEPLGAPRVNG